MAEVCVECIREPYLADLIQQSGEINECEFCGSQDNPTIAFEDLADRVHSVIEEHFEMTSPEPEGLDWLLAKEGRWEQPGQPVVDLVEELLKSDREIAQQVVEYLSEVHDPAGKDALIEPGRFYEDSMYEERPIDTYSFEESWDAFRDSILHRSRFFNQLAYEILDHIFAGIDKLQTRNGESVVQSLGSTHRIFRARYAATTDYAEEILRTLPQSLGSPPSSHARSGRMNAEGVSVFYGATDDKTCVSELRPPVGSKVIVGCFRPLVELRILDLTRLRAVFLRGSLFDPEHSESLSRLQFLKHLVGEISQPILPHDESLGYIPTQAIAEYLTSHTEIQLDGIMFSSSQTNETSGQFGLFEEQRKNIVLFPHASGVAPYELPAGTEVDIDWMPGDPEDPDYEVTIIEDENRSTGAQSKGDRASRWRGLNWKNGRPMKDGEIEDFLEPSIELLMDDVRVLQIRKVVFEWSTLQVRRVRLNSGDFEF